MSDLPWSISDDTENYALTPVEKRYCATRENESTYTQAKIEERLKDKISQGLPNRIQELIDDILLISRFEVNLLNNEESDELREQIFCREKRAEIIAKSQMLHQSEFSESDGTRLGFELGYALRQLTRHGSRVDHQSENILYGMLIGLYADESGTTSNRANEIDQVLKNLSQSIQKRSQRAHALYNPELEEYIDARDEEIKKIFADYGININFDHITPRDLEMHFLNPTNYRANSDKMRQVAEFTFQYYNLNLMSNFYTKLYDDVEFIDSAAEQGLSIKKALKCVFDNNISLDNGISVINTGMSRSDISFAKYHNQCVSALNKMAHENISKNYPQDPILDYDHESWKFTEYGQIVAYTLFEKSDPAWIYHYIINPSELTEDELAMIEQVILRPTAISDDNTKEYVINQINKLRRPTLASLPNSNDIDDLSTILNISHESGATTQSKMYAR